ncbi:DUF305 domain-containing protein [Ornithinimicrobium sp. W1679]|uniref:DUF305 domain-containing protein n=1 Tax=Ornithinimicrobium sp. W1679 TaxID=3418770 RepID=UPI003CEA3494
MRSTSWRCWASPLLALSLAVLAGCSEAEAPRASVRTVEPERPVIQPGRPGEDSAVHTGTVEITQEPVATADVRYMQGMITHHAQALRMVELASGLEDPQVRALAERIRAAQGPELTSMASWLVRHGYRVPQEAVDSGVDVEAMGGRVGAVELAGSGHGGHGGMPGMATEEQLDELASSKGTEADRLFLELMTAHHEGALTMVVEHLGEGSDIQAVEMSNEVYVEQSAEIDRMQELLASLNA